MSVNLFSINQSHVGELLPIEQLCHSHPWSEKTLASCIDGRYFGQGIKDSAETIVGYYIGEHVAGEGTLMNICVSPEFQGKGFGKLLLNAFLQQSRDLSLQKIWLEVRAKNFGAQMLYINAGFTETDRRTGYYPSANGFGYEDAIVMRKIL